MQNQKRLINDEQKAFILSKATAYRIAKDTGLAADTVYSFLNGKRFLDIDKLETICRYVGISLADFFALGNNGEVRHSDQLRSVETSTGV